MTLGARNWRNCTKRAANKRERVAQLPSSRTIPRQTVSVRREGADTCRRCFQLLSSVLAAWQVIKAKTSSEKTKVLKRLCKQDARKAAAKWPGSSWLWSVVQIMWVSAEDSQTQVKAEAQAQLAVRAQRL